MEEKRHPEIKHKGLASGGEVTRPPVLVGDTTPDYAARRTLEKITSLSDLSGINLPVTRSEDFTDSIQAMLDSGALPNSKGKRIERLTKARVRKIAAYMSLDHTSLSETKGFRLRNTYRMIYYMAWCTGDLSSPGLLGTILQDNHRPCPSSHPFQPPVKSYMYGTARLTEIFNAMTEVEATYTLQPDKQLPAGMTYLPPPPPDSAWVGGTFSSLPYLRRGEPTAGYDPEGDLLYNLWLDAYAILAEMLNIPEGSEAEPEAGVYGTMGLFSAGTARFLWPTKDELLLYEMELMMYLFDKLVESGRKAVEKQLMKELGYTRPEAVILGKTALRCGDILYGDDIDVSKVRELLSLEEISEKAGKGEDPRAQIAARKQIQLLSGFIRSDKSAELEDFRDLASRALNDPDDLGTDADLIEGQVPF